MKDQIIKNLMRALVRIDHRLVVGDLTEKDIHDTWTIAHEAVAVAQYDLEQMNSTETA